LSVVPNDRLYPADSLNLITFPLNESFTGASITRDIYTRYKAFVKSAIIKNNQLTTVVTYRTDPNKGFRSIPVSSAKPVPGWFSYLEILSADASPDYEIELECVDIKDAIRK